MKFLMLICIVVSCANPSVKTTASSASLPSQSAQSSEGLNLVDRVVVFTDLDRTMVSSDVHDTWPGPFPIVHGYPIGRTATERMVLFESPSNNYNGPVVPVSFIEMIRDSYKRDPNFHFVVVTQNMDGVAAHIVALLVLDKAGVPRSRLKAVQFRDETGFYDKSSFMQNYLRLVGGRPNAIFFDDQRSNIVQAQTSSSVAGNFPILAVLVDPNNPAAAFARADVQQRLRPASGSQPDAEIQDAWVSSIATHATRRAPIVPPLAFPPRGVSSIDVMLGGVPWAEESDDDDVSPILPPIAKARSTVTSGSDAKMSPPRLATGVRRP